MRGSQSKKFVPVEDFQAALCLLWSLHRGSERLKISAHSLDGVGYKQGEGRAHTSVFEGSFAGRVSTGLMHATPGEMKSFKSSADRIALIVAAIEDS